MSSAVTGAAPSAVTTAPNGVVYVSLGMAGALLAGATVIAGVVGYSLGEAKKRKRQS